MENTKIDFYGALESREFLESDGRIPFILGEKEACSIAVKDMAELSRMVIAGATGTGKSTLVHGIILSMVRRMPPDKLRLVLCDTKMIEFQCYKSLPHMLFPPQTDLNNIENALTWVTIEMQKRMSDFAGCGCRSLSAYNEIASEKDIEEIPYIVVVIDDASFAMEQENIKQVIDNLARKGHAVGIYLILVTQIAGAKQIADTIKSSIPTRAVFNVFSNDEEKLLLDLQKNEMVSDVGEIIFYEIKERKKEKITCFHVTPNICKQVVEEISEQYADFYDAFIHRKLIEAESQISTDKDSPDPASEYLGHYEMLPATVDGIPETGQAPVPGVTAPSSAPPADYAKIIEGEKDWRRERPKLSGVGYQKERGISMFCQKCGAKMPDGARFCPSCGTPARPAPVPQYPPVPQYQKKQPKRHPVLGTILLIFGIFLIIGALSDGGGPQKVSGDPAKISESAQATEADFFTVGDTVSINGVNVSFVSVTENSGANYTTPDAGKVFLVCEFKIDNQTGKDIAVSSLMSFSAYVDDYSAPLSISAIVSSGKTQLDGSVAPGKKIAGVVGYDADKNWKEFEIRFAPCVWSGEEITFTYSK